MADEEEIVQKKQKGSSLVLILVSVLLLVVLIVGGAVIYLLANNDKEPTAEELAQQEMQEKKEKNKNKKKGAETSGEIGIIYPMDNFIVNLASDGGNKYLKCRIELEQNIPTLTPELDKKKPLVQDIIITILSSKSYEEISTSKGKERLKDELLNRINEVLNDGYIKNIYFTDFVIS